MKHLSILLLAIMVVACGKDNSSGGSGTQRNVNPIRDAEGAQNEIISLVNSHRARMGLPRLQRSFQADIEAQDFTRYMAESGRFSHAGMNVRCARLRASLGGNACGEVISRGYNLLAQQVFDGWMNSMAHRNRLADSRYDTIGVGLALDSSGRSYWTIIFLDR